MTFVACRVDHKILLLAKLARHIQHQAVLGCSLLLHHQELILLRSRLDPLLRQLSFTCSMGLWWDELSKWLSAVMMLIQIEQVLLGWMQILLAILLF